MVSYPRRLIIRIAVVVAILSGWTIIRPLHAARFPRLQNGPIELNVRSKYSHILIRRKNNTRTMVFVRDSGEEALETQMDLTQPHELRFAYLRYMFMSYLFQPNPKEVLIVGLGGGSMIHFLQHYDPLVRVDAIEIDPVVVDIASKYFGIKPKKNVNIITGDGFDYLQNTKVVYDVIYMDAFLKPSIDTDSTGTPVRLRTQQFYQDIQTKLRPGGVVMFNINSHPKIAQDLQGIRESFPQIYVFPLPRSHGLIVAGSTAPKRERIATLRRRATKLDDRFKTSFSFRGMIRPIGP